MKYFFIRASSGIVILLFLLFVAPNFNIDWVQEGNPKRIFAVPIALVGGWLSLYFYKVIKKN
ncbi:hypothetical protein FS935_00795 [Metabacillus litoralis]|uniref:ATPase n=1 Tax=Metabacillus litoralis TaxID=152268 RepID=A0A5C6W4Q0_9BACI|nr:hypothetical protein [Metabacillus litoralis]TXC92771.1 hypothetical protein FS935_00795 [Metabacillus litoralis]